MFPRTLTGQYWSKRIFLKECGSGSAATVRPNMKGKKEKKTKTNQRVEQKRLWPVSSALQNGLRLYSIHTVTDGSLFKNFEMYDSEKKFYLFLLISFKILLKVIYSGYHI